LRYQAPCQKDATHNPNTALQSACLVDVRLRKPHPQQQRGLGPRVKSAFLSTSFDFTLVAAVCGIKREASDILPSALLPAFFRQSAQDQRAKAQAQWTFLLK
jgi:hypothetical protein